MKDDTVEAWKKRALESEGKLKNSMRQNEELIKELGIKDRTMAVLIAAGYLSKNKLEQAIEIAGGIS